jgi:hypothetical protein
MQAAVAQRIEAGVGYAAAASFAVAVGFAIFHAVDRITDLAGMVAAGGVSAIAAFPGALFLLRALEGGPKPFPQPIFDILKIEPVPLADLGELVLSDSDRLDELVLGETDRLDDQPLMLEDVLVDVEPDSRVVQLFDPSAMPTPGQLKDRIDRHLDGGTSHSPSPDASEALLAALADLRRSLR